MFSCITSLSNICLLLTLIGIQESKVYQKGEKVEVKGVVRHLDISHGEAGHNNTKLRIIYPSWLSFEREGII